MSYTPPNILRDFNPVERTARWVTLGESNQQYFSGLDASIHFGDIFMGQLVSLEYQMQEMVLPLFSYGDYTMRRVVHGMRMVRGTFSIVFQQTYLFYQILNYLTGIFLNEPKSSLPAAPMINTGLSSNSTQFADYNSAVGFLTGTPTTIASLGAIEPQNQLTYLSSLSTSLKTKNDISQYNLHMSHLKQLQQQKIKTWTQAEDAGQSMYQQSSLLSNMQTRLTPLYSRYETIPEGFDIKITLGQPPQGDVITEWTSGLPIPPSYAEDAQNGSAAFNNKAVKNRIERALEMSPPWTARKLIGVRITGMGQVIDDSGRPLIETYSFIASDLI